jgi:hypothetical protein
MKAEALLKLLSVVACRVPLIAYSCCWRGRSNNKEHTGSVSTSSKRKESNRMKGQVR